MPTNRNKKWTSREVTIPRNKTVPLRIAFLGGAKTGKTTLISRIVTGQYRETYYPLRNTIPVLYTYRPDISRQDSILDPFNVAHFLKSHAENHIILSPALLSALQKIQSEESTTGHSETALNTSKNGIYHVYSTEEPTEKIITPILTELIDTPAFEPRKSVPFLEVSLHAKLAKTDLRNLANDAGQGVDAEPLLVASGAGELNGAIDGYIFVYSAVPQAQLPSYEASSQENQPVETSLSILPYIKDGLTEAWSEYLSYKSQSIIHAESDIFSLKNAFRNMFDSKEKPPLKPRSYLKSLPSQSGEAVPLPPIVIVCTHVKLPLASPKLIEEGKEFAKECGSTFVSVDITYDVSVVLDLMIREVVERRGSRRST